MECEPVFKCFVRRNADYKVNNNNNNNNNNNKGIRIGEGI
jgi:hypothetical protein